MMRCTNNNKALFVKDAINNTDQIIGDFIKLSSIFDQDHKKSLIANCTMGNEQ